jgi:hypothetical protein
MGCTVASGGRFQPGTQRRVVLTPDRAWAPKDGFALQRAGLALLHDRPFHGRHRDSKPARGFSHGLTLGHRAHQAFFEVGRIGTHTRFPRINRACFRFPQVALGTGERGIKANDCNSRRFLPFWDDLAKTMVICAHTKWMKSATSVRRILLHTSLSHAYSQSAQAAGGAELRGGPQAASQARFQSPATQHAGRGAHHVTQRASRCVGGRS